MWRNRPLKWIKNGSVMVRLHEGQELEEEEEEEERGSTVVSREVNDS